MTLSPHTELPLGPRTIGQDALVPKVPARLLRVGGAVAFAVAGVLCLALVFDESDPGPWWFKAAALVLGAALVVAAIRCLLIGIDSDQDEVVVRNVTRTHRLAIAEISGFGIAWSRWHGGPALAVLTGGRSLVVTAYPITRIPGVSRRRTARVEGLNDWLAEQKR